VSLARVLGIHAKPSDVSVPE
jgi:hypothetical protein